VKYVYLWTSVILYAVAFTIAITYLVLQDEQNSLTVILSLLCGLGFVVPSIILYIGKKLK